MSGSDADNGATLPPPEMGKPRCGTRTRAADPRLSPDAQDRIGRDLRRMYEALLLEPLPQRIRDLVASLGSTPRRTLQSRRALRRARPCSRGGAVLRGGRACL